MINIGTSAPLKYIRYSRKSSESKERQALSIRDQNYHCDNYAKSQGLQVLAEFEEEKSAFKPNRREKLNEMLRLIKSGEANAILTWKPDRLCRNPEEGGKILQMLQDGFIKEIRTPEGDVYTPESDHLILQIHFGMANQFSRNLSQNVRRGLNRKAIDRHEYPRPAPLGFIGIGERGQRNIAPDPLTAPLIKQAFELEAMSGKSLGYIANNMYQTGLRTRRGKRVSKSHMYHILTSPTYYGYFVHNGEVLEGNFEPIISKQLFDLAQAQLEDKSKPKLNNWEKEFSGLFKCGSCGCAITTSVKVKHYNRTNNTQKYVYHNCTHRKGGCTEKPITDAELKQMLHEKFDQISIDKEVWQLGVNLVKAKYQDEFEKNKHRLTSVNREKEELHDKINRLIEMRSNDELTKKEFLEQKNRLTDRSAQLTRQVTDKDDNIKSWLELVEEFFNNAYAIKEVLDSGNTDQKQAVLRAVGENFKIQSKKLTFSFKKPYDVLISSDVRTNVHGN